MDSTSPLLDGSLFLPEIVDLFRSERPQKPLFAFPDHTNSGLVTITALEFARAAHRVAHELTTSVKPRRERGETVAVLSLGDTIVYHAVDVGMQMAGLVPFPMSPRNSPQAIASMLNKTECRHILIITPLPATFLDEVCGLSALDLTITRLPPIARIYPKLGRETAENAFAPFPYKRPHPEEVAMYLHSSGSTGFPKPIAITHLRLIQWLRQCVTFVGQISQSLKEPSRGTHVQLGVAAFPPFHSLAFFTQLYAPLISDAVASVYRPSSVEYADAQPVAPTPDNVLENARLTNADVVYVVPMFLEEMLHSPDAISALKTYDRVLYGGGILPEKVGCQLFEAGVPLATSYGGTEFGAPAAPPNIGDTHEGDWGYFYFPDATQVRWADQGDGTFELHVLSNGVYDIAPEYHNLPDVEGYATSDIFVKHPSKENLWRIVGRKDDVIVLSSGEKTVPAPMESAICAHPLVMGAVMFGEGQSTVGVILESRGAVADERKFVGEVWPYIEDANSAAPAFSRIFKSTVLVAKAEKPFPRAGKGTVLRKATLNEYKTEIDALYENFSQDSTSELAVNLADLSNEALQEWLVKQVRSSVPRSSAINATSDLFSFGFDSLSIAHIYQAIIFSVEPRMRDSIPRNVLYEYSTIAQLADALYSTMHNTNENDNDWRKSHRMSMQSMLARYKVPTPQGAVVLLTGSTGHLGSYILHELLSNDGVSKIYAFNRASSGRSGRERQEVSFASRKLPVSSLDSSSHKLVFLDGDTSEPELGLSAEVLRDLRNEVSVIIHNAWRVDFNLPLIAFEANIEATHNLVEFALSASSAKRVRFVFVSSVAAVQGWSPERGPVPEAVVDEADVALGSGYGESKYIGEKIVAESGLEGTCVRVGQIAGGPGGIWPTTEWVPIVVKSSVVFGAMPELPGDVSWIPVNAVASALVHICLKLCSPHDDTYIPPVLNLVHPHPAAFLELVEAMRDAVAAKKRLLSKDDDLPLVSYDEWLSRLEDLEKGQVHWAGGKKLSEVPALKIIDFLRNLTCADGNKNKFSTDQIEHVVPSLRELRPLGKGDAKAWVEYWVDFGFL
ncbi:acetyl-CoA synthetase-like protein [Coniophora puteana RWD-64-598 SS2]|uniref:Acetyl-CoA synthetase-like protein n=1 Tax=Coniophora puteana (strain RWD-64-598) TaxID=741705 RepID=A0A5M3MWE5_CONPW|nr:acetyl-CoA synthetase-like protein [Coniophora puteana RWD-64-598 SS2]EIW83469.1 acetyl-CoA synthetase-like protein [Coniophora puteana RWD-64-598 SS2]